MKRKLKLEVNKNMTSNPVNKEEILKKIREGKVLVYKPGMKIRVWKYLGALEKCQPATIAELTGQIGGKERGVKAIYGRLMKKGEVKAVVYKNEIYYMTTEYYDKHGPDKKE